MLILPAMSKCSLCSGPAQYYCKACKSKLCPDHIIISNSIYYCKECDDDCYDPKCHTCGSEASFVRHDSVHRCEWCKKIDIEDGVLYHQQLPQLIFSSINLLNKKLTEVWDLTQQYLDLVRLVYDMRKAKIMLFREVEDEIALLRTKISTFIDHLVKFENETFTLVDEKLRNIGYMRYTNLNNVDKAEEILDLLKGRSGLLDEKLETKFAEIEEDFGSLSQKVDFLNFQFRLLRRIHHLLPEDENEELISILPRIWLKKNASLPRQFLVVLTNKNLYLMREKGLFNVKLKNKATISLSHLTKKHYSHGMFVKKKFKFKTRLDSYMIFGRKESLSQISTYFNIIENYIDYSIHKSSIIEGLKFYSLTMNELKSNIQRHGNHLRAYLLNKRELKRELYWRDGQDARFNKLFEQLLSVERKIHRLNESRQYESRSSRGIDGLLRKLTREHNRLKHQLEDVRKQSDEFDDLWEF